MDFSGHAVHAPPALYWFAEHNGDGVCTDPPADHGWGIDIPTVEADVELQFDHVSDFPPDLCSFFDV